MSTNSNRSVDHDDGNAGTGEKLPAARSLGCYRTGQRGSIAASSLQGSGRGRQMPCRPPWQPSERRREQNKKAPRAWIPSGKKGRRGRAFSPGCCLARKRRPTVGAAEGKLRRRPRTWAMSRLRRELLVPVLLLHITTPDQDKEGWRASQIQERRKKADESHRTGRIWRRELTAVDFDLQVSPLPLVGL